MQPRVVVGFRDKANCFAYWFRVLEWRRGRLHRNRWERALIRIALLAASSVLVVLAACAASEDAVDADPVADLPLAADALGDIVLGMNPDDVLASLSPQLGGPSTDTGWLLEGSGIYGECPTPLRVISWGSLTTFHMGGPLDGTFFAYSYGFDFEEALSGVDPRNLNIATPDGIGVGSSVADLRALDADVVLDGDAAIDVWTFAIDPHENPHLRGQVSGPDETDTVLFLETSTGCE